MDLGVRIIAPFALTTTAGESLLYEAHIVDFGGAKGTVVGLLDRDSLTDSRRQQGYFCSDLSGSYRIYNRDLFMDTLNDWQWFGKEGAEPSWYTGKKWS